MAKEAGTTEYIDMTSLSLAVQQVVEEMFDNGEMLIQIQEDFSPDDFFEFDQIKEWIRDNHNMDDVYDGDEINEWWFDHNDVVDYVDYDVLAELARTSYDPEELFGSDYMYDWSREMWYDNIKEEAIDDIKSEADPEDIFEVETLEEWAREHGMIMPEDCPEPEPSPEPGHIE